MTDFELRVHAKIVAMQHLLQNLYYMHYRAANATREEISAHHAEMLKTVTEDLRRGLAELGPSADPRSRKFDRERGRSGTRQKPDCNSNYVGDNPTNVKDADQCD